MTPRAPQVVSGGPAVAASASAAAGSAAPAGSSRRRMPTEAAVGWRAWLELTKPKIVLLMLITCVSAMIVANGGWVDARLMLLTLAGLAPSIGGASALNHVLDRDLDRRMARTRFRPVAAGTISARAASVYGISLFTLGGTFLCLYVNPASAWWALMGGASYVLLYTPLKRVTVHNTVLGGLAGSAPPLVGWAAVTGDVNALMAWMLFGIMFLWQPAHFWPLSLVVQRDYAAAGFKMMPATHGERATVNATWRWTLVTVAATAVPVFTGHAGWIYAAGMVLANVYLVRRMWALMAADRARGKDEAAAPALVDGPGSAGHKAAIRAFLGSMVWLAIIFVALVIDAIILG